MAMYFGVKARQGVGVGVGGRESGFEGVRTPPKPLSA